MSKKKKKERPSTWSIDMLEEFRDFLVNRILPVSVIDFVIKEGVNSITLTSTEEKHHIYFLGELIGIEDVCSGLVPLESSTEEYRNYIGYIEILNGNSDEGEPIPMIRVCIKQDIAFFETLGKMAIESRLLDPNKLMSLSIHVDHSGLKNISPENILNMKLPIEAIGISQRVSFI